MSLTWLLLAQAVTAQVIETNSSGCTAALGLRRQPSQTSAACGVWLWVHVPKTGGSTVECTLLQEAAQSAGWPWVAINPVLRALPSNASIKHAHLGFHKLWGEVLRDLNATARPRLVVKMHSPSRHDPDVQDWVTDVEAPLERLLHARGCFLRRATVLREAAARAKSHVFFKRVPHSSYSTAIKSDANGHINFLEAVFPVGGANGGRRNVSAEDVARARKILSRFDLIGRAEELRQFMSAFAAQLGVAKVPDGRCAVTPSVDKYPLTPKEEALTVRENALDAQLYRSFCA